MVELNVRGVTKTLYFGGVAEAYFPDRTDDDLRSLKPSDEFGLVWSDAAFFTQDLLLGPVHAQLLRGAASPTTSGRVRSLAAAAPVGALAAEGVDFFPAVNTNELHFEFLLPRLQLNFRSVGAIVNSATIKQIPPYGTVYRLVRPARLASQARSSRFMSALVGETEIQTCNVKLHIAGGIELDILDVKDGPMSVQFSLSAKNVTQSPTLTASWMVWPRPDPSFTHPVGSVELPQGKEIRFAVSAQRDIFFEPKWIVLSGAKPFEVDASAAVQVPGLT
jgi:hypothetical protein